MKLYAIIRGDLSMTAGKAAAQAGHAYLEAFLRASPGRKRAYRADGIGTKIALIAPHLGDLLWAEAICRRHGFPHALITDSGHIMPPHFDGSPIITALGIGPIDREQIRFITDRFKLVGGTTV